MAERPRITSPRLGATPPPTTVPSGEKRPMLQVSRLPRPQAVSVPLVMLTLPDSSRAAAYRVLRHRLSRENDPKVILVTSPVAREGKTICAANLAIALGESGRARVLLVEANLRTPSLGDLFGYVPSECFAEQMARHHEHPTEPWSVVAAYEPWLHVLAVAPKNAGRGLVDGPAFTHAIEHLRKTIGYDYVVIDAPPVLGSADVNVIQDSADGVVMVTRAKHSSKKRLQRAVDQLQPVRLLGMVLLDE
jgi:Mrp family chromosome partitioning ATPase